MPELLPIPVRLPVVTCFSGLEFKKFEDLVLIPFFGAREPRF